MMENNYFFKKLTSKHIERKERCACNYTARNEEFQFIKQKLYSERQITYSENEES